MSETKPHYAKPCGHGRQSLYPRMRVTVGMILGQLGSGQTIDELLADCAYLEREDILQAIASTKR